jgi:O-antigen/teichoic acid export membrane protein
MALFGARVAGAGALFVANLFLARALGPDEFGRYALSISVLTFAALFLDLGHFASGARLLTELDPGGDTARGLVGTLIGMTLAVGALFMAVVVGVSAVADLLFEEEIGTILRGALWLTPALILPLLMEQVLKALARNYLLAAWSFASRMLFLLLLAALLLRDRLDALSATAAHLGGILIASLVALPALRPRFKGWRQHVSQLQGEHRRFGHPLFVGRLANLASYRTDVWFLGYFRNANAVGQYTLAMSFANLIAFYSQAVASTGFRELAKARSVPAHILTSNRRGIVLLASMAILLGESVALLYLGSSYGLVAWILVPCVIAIALQGAYQPYNSWLLAHGFGVQLRSFLLAVAVINLVANAVLIPSAGALGAALASAIGMGAYFVMAHRAVSRLSSVHG